MKSPRELDLPFDDWRPGQRFAIRTILHTKKTHVIVQAPTGAGKSTLALGVSQLDPRRSVILTGTNALLQQYLVTAPWLSMVNGMANYECLAARDEFRKIISPKRLPLMVDDGPCHTGLHCTLKDGGCLYFDATRSFVASSTGLTNYPMWLSTRRHGRGLGMAQMLLCDEADTLPEQLMQACQIAIPNTLIDSRRAPRTVKSWRQWAAQKLDELAPGSDDDQRRRREKLVEGLRALSRIDHTWAWDVDPYTHQTIFEPTVPRLLLPMLHTFDHASTVVYLSATITPSTLGLLNIDPDDVDYLAMKATFPVERRPIYITPGARVDYKMTSQDKGRWIDTMDCIIGPRLDRKGIIMPVSFDRGEAIYEGSRHKRAMILHRRGQRLDQVLAQYLEAEPPAVLISPSVTRGYDFPGRDCEYIIVAKLPFPNTSSKIMRARVKATPGYRDHVTVQALVQECGRGMRSDEDQCETFLVDGHYSWWAEQAVEMMPEFFREAIVKTSRVVLPPPRLKR